VVNTRGMGTTTLNKPHLMSGATTDDIRHALKTALSRKELAAYIGASLAAAADSGGSSSNGTRGDFVVPVIGVGFSLGGNVLCKYVGEQGQRNEATGLDAAIAIHAPWDFHVSAGHMRRLTQRVIYQPHLLHGLRSYILRHREVLAGDRPVAAVLNSGVLDELATVQDFDEAVIVPHFGYESVEDYYSQAMSLPYLEHTKIPTFCLGAADDVICPPPALRRWELLCQRNRNVMYVQTPAGGHLGFLGDPWSELWNVPNFGEKLTLNVASSVALWLEQRDAPTST
jgi:predicted alpha/beta-fold hydrolase